MKLTNNKAHTIELTEQELYDLRYVLTWYSTMTPTNPTEERAKIKAKDLIDELRS